MFIALIISTCFFFEELYENDILPLRYEFLCKITIINIIKFILKIEMYL